MKTLSTQEEFEAAFEAAYDEYSRMFVEGLKIVFEFNKGKKSENEMTSEMFAIAEIKSTLEDDMEEVLLSLREGGIDTEEMQERFDTIINSNEFDWTTRE